MLMLTLQMLSMTGFLIISMLFYFVSMIMTIVSLTVSYKIPMLFSNDISYIKEHLAVQGISNDSMVESILFPLLQNWANRSPFFAIRFF